MTVKSIKWTTKFSEVLPWASVTWFNHKHCCETGSKALFLKDTKSIPIERPVPQIAWFKRLQRNSIYNYYEVHGGPGKTRDGYLVAVRFLSDPPAIDVEHNYEADDGLDRNLVFV